MSSENDRGTGRANEKWKARGIAWRVFFYVIGAYLCLYVVGLLSAQATQE